MLLARESYYMRRRVVLGTCPWYIMKSLDAVPPPTVGGSCLSCGGSYAPALRDLVVSCERLAGASSLVLIGYQARNAVEQLFFKRMRRAFADAVPVPREQLHPDFQADDTLQLLQFHKRPPA